MNATNENSPNDPLHEPDDSIIDRVDHAGAVVHENDVNELDKIFCDKTANSANASDNDDSHSIPGMGDDITNDDRKDNSSMQTSNNANSNANLDSNVFSDVDQHHHHHHHHHPHQQHQQQQQPHQTQHQQQQHQEVSNP